MKKLLTLLCLVAIVSVGYNNDVSATSSTIVNTRHEKRYTNITLNYGDYILRQYYRVHTEEWVEAGTIRGFEDSCPSGWKDISGGITPWSVDVPLSVSITENSDIFVASVTSYLTCEKISSGYYTTIGAEQWEDATTSQRLYWSSVPSDEKNVFSYQSNFAAPEIEGVLIEGEVLIMHSLVIPFFFGIDRYTHYERNQYNIDFPVTKAEFDTTTKNAFNCIQANDFANYFHKLAHYNGDTTNLGNKKYLCDVPSQYQSQFPDGTSEVIYNASGFREDHDLIQGTFNFDSGFFNHYIQDVYPYLVWGNSFDDDSSIHERYYWDQDSAYSGIPVIGTTDYYKYRGNTLFSKPVIHFHLKPWNAYLTACGPLNEDMYNIN